MFGSKLFSYTNRIILFFFLISVDNCIGDNNIDERLDCLTESKLFWEPTLFI